MATTTTQTAKNYLIREYLLISIHNQYINTYHSSIFGMHKNKRNYARINFLINTSGLNVLYQFISQYILNPPKCTAAALLTQFVLSILGAINGYFIYLMVNNYYEHDAQSKQFSKYKKKSNKIYIINNNKNK